MKQTLLQMAQRRVVKRESHMCHNSSCGLLKVKLIVSESEGNIVASSNMYYTMCSG
jgi:hypothetical protein